MISWRLRPTPYFGTLGTMKTLWTGFCFLKMIPRRRISGAGSMEEPPRGPGNRGLRPQWGNVANIWETKVTRTPAELNHDLHLRPRSCSICPFSDSFWLSSPPPSCKQYGSLVPALTLLLSDQIFNPIWSYMKGAEKGQSWQTRRRLRVRSKSNINCLAEAEA